MSSKRQRTVTITFRASPKEQAIILDAARRESVSVASLARQCVLASAKGQSLELIGGTARELKRVTVEIERIGQVARKRVIAPLDAEKIVFELRSLHRTIFKFYYDERDV